MAFILKHWGTLGGHGGRGVSFQLFSYFTTDDKSSTLVDGYFDGVKGDLSVNDVIFVQNETESFFLRILEAGLDEIKTGLTLSPVWLDDGTRLKPVNDGRIVYSGTGGFEGESYKGLDLIASQIVETDGNKKLISVVKGSAYNKNFGVNIGDVVDIGATLGDNELLETDGSGKAITSPKGSAYNSNFTSSDPLGDSDSASQGVSTDLSRSDHQHPKVLSSTTVIGQVELATTAETTAGVDTTRAITPAGLVSSIYDISPYPDGYQKGGVPTYVSAHTISLTDWKGRDSEDTLNFSVPADASVVIDSPLADTTYHLQCLSNDDGTLTKFAFSLNKDASDVLDTTYTKYKPRFPIRTNSSTNIRNFISATEFPSGELEFTFNEVYTPYLTTNTYPTSVVFFDTGLPEEIYARLVYAVNSQAGAVLQYYALLERTGVDYSPVSSTNSNINITRGAVAVRDTDELIKQVDNLRRLGIKFTSDNSVGDFTAKIRGYITWGY